MVRDAASDQQVVRRITRRKFLNAAAGASGLALLAACTPTATPSASSTAAPGATGPKVGGQLVYVTTGDGTGLDPAQNILGTDLEAFQQIFEGLVRYKTVTLEDMRGGASPSGGVEPELAESWTSTPDNLVWTFKLRRGVTFHDGSPFNADAVVTSYDRILNKNNPYYFAGKTRAGGQLSIAIKSYRAVDPYTFELTLSRGYATLFLILAHGEASIVSPTALAKYGVDFASHPVGTGAFKFTEWIKSDHMAFERYDGWWGGKTYLDKVIFRPIPESAVGLATMEKGEADFLDGVPPDDTSRIKASPNLILTPQPSGINGVWMNNIRKPYDDVRVRQALNYAIDRETIHKTLYNGLGDLVSSPYTRFTPYFNTSLKPWPYDPAKAKQLLAEAGYANGFDMEMVTVNAAFLFNPIGGPRLAAALQPYLAAVNVRAKISVIEDAAQTAVRSSGNFDVMVGNGNSTQSDPDRACFPLFHSGEWTRRNVTRYKNARVDELIIEGQQEFDESKRAAIYMEIQSLVYQDAPWIWINSPTDFLVANKGVHDILVANSIHRRFRGAWRS
jgi:ABC-type transport system substrate-binding protein